MKFTLFAILVAMLAAATTATAQTAATTTNNAAVRIADAAQPAGVLVNPIVCLERAAVVFAKSKDPAKEAAKYCENAFHSGGKIMEKVANEAADANQAFRPVIVDGYYGSYGYTSGYVYRSYNGGREGVNTTSTRTTSVTYGAYKK